MGCPKLEYNLSSEPRLLCMYNAADLENKDGLVKLVQLSGSSGMTATQTCNTQGYLTNLKTVKGATTIRNMDFVFDAAKGNLTSRTGMISQTENFLYDDLDRLTQVKHGSTQAMVIGGYYANGNIQNKTGLGVYSYGSNAGPHALTGVENTGNLLNTRKQAIDYNAYNKATLVTDTVINTPYLLDITYGPDHQRWKTVLKTTNNNSEIKKIIYAGNYEEITQNGITQKLIYLPGGGIYVKQSGQSDKIYYTHKDHLGSIIKITDDNGTAVFSATYDAWGKQTVTTNTFKFHRGYTGHEHLPEFGLINMNGRMYDPIVGRFLSPDPFVQAPDFSQSYNRYSYCLNNPLIYTDPSGEIIFTALAAIFCPPLIPVAIFADVFSTGNVVTHAMKGDIHNAGDFFKYYGQGAAVGAALGATWYYSGPAGLAGMKGLLGPMAYTLKVAGGIVHTAMSVYGIAQTTMGVAGMIGGAIDDGWTGAGRAGKLFLGNFYLDENSFVGGIWKGYMRHTPWEGLNTLVGHSYTQIRNMSHLVDRVEYNAGSTFAITENVTNFNGWEGISLGNFSAVKIDRPFSGFDAHSVFWHEFGHTKDSRLFGPLYIPIEAMFSAWDWARGWSGGWTENWADRYSYRYKKRRELP